MNVPSGDPVDTITEAEATGDIAALYADIRATLGVPVVNLIWRHLAIVPGGLDWAWESLKPLYRNGAIAAQARALRDGLQVPVLPGISAAGLRAAGLSDEDIAWIVMVMRSYERSNAMNIIALGTLAAKLDGATAPGLKAAPPDDEAAVTGRMPDLLSLDHMTPDVGALVVALNRIGGRDEILASMYRHLANWPPFLSLVQVLITPFEADDRLEPVIRATIAEGRRRAAGLVDDLAEPETPLAADVADELGRVLNKFIDEPIGKMIAIVPLILRAMPE